MKLTLVPTETAQGGGDRSLQEKFNERDRNAQFDSFTKEVCKLIHIRWTKLENTAIFQIMEDFGSTFLYDRKK